MTAGLELSAAEARRTSLRAQRLGFPRPSGEPTHQHIEALLSALGAIQLDAVNVLVRAHYLTIYSRLGRYPARLLDDVMYRRRTAFEYWGHAASILPVSLYPLLRWRMAGYERNKHWRAFQERLERERPGYLAAIEREIAERGPLAFGDLTDPARRERHQTKYAESSLLWYRWSDGKSALEGLYDAGRLAVAGRRGFERLYDLPARVLPADVLAASPLEPAEAQRHLVRHAVRALGVGTARDVADYFRMPAAATRARLRELVESQDVYSVHVEGWPDPAYLARDADPAPVEARTLLSPFDPLLWERTRVQRLFGFQHSFELYVKAANRRYGYYVLPFLLGESLVGRVNLKADRDRRALLVLGAYAEPSASAPAVATELQTALRDLACWLDLDSIEVSERGDLTAHLRGGPA